MNKKYSLICLACFINSAYALTGDFSFKDNLLEIPCIIDQVKLECSIDTGSAFTAVSSDEFLSYKKIGSINHQGASGSIIKSDKIEINSLSLAGSMFSTMDVARFEPRYQLPTTLGLDVFNLSHTWDFVKNRLDFGPIPESLNKVESLIKYNLINIPITVSDLTINAAWDTGASLSVVDIKIVENNSEDFDFVRTINNGSDSTGTTMKVNMYKLKTMKISNMVFKDLLVVAVDLSGPRSVMKDFPAVFLGHNVMRGHVWQFDLKKNLWGIR